MKKTLLIAAMLISFATIGALIAKDDSTLASGDCSVKTLCIIPMQDITEDMTAEVMEGKRQDIAIECTEGLSIPISPFLKGNLINLESKGYDVLSLNVLNAFYFKSDGREILFSRDLKDWKDFFTFVTGNATVSLSVREGRILADIGAELNVRR